MTKITVADLAAESVELLPSRDTLLLNIGSVNWSGVLASNTAAALNLGTVASVANAQAGQSITVVQF